MLLSLRHFKVRSSIEYFLCGFIRKCIWVCSQNFSLHAPKKKFKGKGGGSCSKWQQIQDSKRKLNRT